MFTAWLVKGAYHGLDDQHLILCLTDGFRRLQLLLQLLQRLAPDEDGDEAHYPCINVSGSRLISGLPDLIVRNSAIQFLPDSFDELIVHKIGRNADWILSFVIMIDLVDSDLGLSLGVG